MTTKYSIILFLIYLLNRYISTMKYNLVQRIALLKTVDTVSVRKAGQEEGPCMCGLGPEVNSQEVRSKATDGQTNSLSRPQTHLNPATHCCTCTVSQLSSYSIFKLHFYSTKQSHKFEGSVLIILVQWNFLFNFFFLIAVEYCFQLFFCLSQLRFHNNKSAYFMIISSGNHDFVLFINKTKNDYILDAKNCNWLYDINKVKNLYKNITFQPNSFFGSNELNYLSYAS